MPQALIALSLALSLLGSVSSCQPQPPAASPSPRQTKKPEPIRDVGCHVGDDYIMRCRIEENGKPVPNKNTPRG